MTYSDIEKEFDEMWNFNCWSYNIEGSDRESATEERKDEIKSFLRTSIEQALKECRPEEMEGVIGWSGYECKSYNKALNDYDLKVKQFLER